MAAPFIASGLRVPRLRAVLAAAFACVAMVAVGTSALLADRHAPREATMPASAAVLAQAAQLADQLDHGM